MEEVILEEHPELCRAFELVQEWQLTADEPHH